LGSLWSFGIFDQYELVAEREMVSQSQNCGNQLEIADLDDRKSDIAISSYCF
jgi:hypothetical protein